MDRAEALEWAIKYLEISKVSYPYADISEQVDIAIEALQEGTSQNLAKPNNDWELISRPDAIAEITEEMSGAWTESDADFNRGMEMAASIIEELPSVVCDDCIWTVCNYNKVDWDAPSAETHDKRTETHSCISETHGDLISRQDAIETIAKIEVNNQDQQNIREGAVFMLEKLPSAETHGDLISREDAMEEFALHDCTNGNVPYFTGMRVQEILKSLPSAEPVQPQGDLISRQAAIEAVDATWWNARWIRKAIKSLPSAEPPKRTGEWVPCSERLPKEKQEVYVTVYFTEGDTGRAYGYIDGFGNWHLYSAAEGSLNSGYEVTAWMPMPEPYKGGDTE